MSDTEPMTSIIRKGIVILVLALFLSSAAFQTVLRTGERTVTKDGGEDEPALFTRERSTEKRWYNATHWDNATFMHTEVDENGSVTLCNRTDDFNDNELNLAKWGGDYCKPKMETGGGTVREKDGKLVLDLPDYGMASAASVAQDVKGDFDVAIDYDLVSWDPMPRYDDISLGITFDWGTGEQVYMCRAHLAADGYMTGIIPGSAWGQTTTSDTKGKLRLKREGNVFTGYYWNGGWVELGSDTVAANKGGALGVTLWNDVSDGTPCDGTVELDNFRVVSGSANFSVGKVTKDLHSRYRSQWLNYSFAPDMDPAIHEIGLAFKSGDSPSHMDNLSWSYLHTDDSGDISPNVEAASWLRVQAYLDTDNISRPPVLKRVAVNYTFVPEPPTPLSPGEGNWVSNKPEFVWNFTDHDVNDTEAGFRVQVSDTDSFSNINYDSADQSSDDDQSWVFGENSGYSRMADGTWYWRVRNQDNYGGWGNYSAPREFRVESQPPESTIQTPANEGTVSVVGEISGSVMDTGGSGVKKVEISLGTEDGTAYFDGTRWTGERVWLESEISFPDGWRYTGPFPGWDTNATYTVLSRARDVSGNIETEPASSTFTFDPSALTSAIDFPKNGALLNRVEWIRGTATDGTGGAIRKVEISIGGDGAEYWNGSNWSVNESWLTVNGTNEWNFTDLPDWVSGKNYTVRTKAYSDRGVTESPGTGSTFLFDNQAPFAWITFPVYGEKVFKISKIEGEAVDEGGGGVKNIRIYISRKRTGENGSYWDEKNWTGSIWNGKNWTGESSFTETSFIPYGRGGGYGHWRKGSDLPGWDFDVNLTVRVVATDRAGNVQTLNATLPEGRRRGVGGDGGGATITVSGWEISLVKPGSVTIGGNFDAYDPFLFSEVMSKNRKGGGATLGDWWAWLFLANVDGMFGSTINFPVPTKISGGWSWDWETSYDYQGGKLGKSVDLGITVTVSASLEITVSAAWEDGIEISSKGEITLSASGGCTLAEVPLPHMLGLVRFKVMAQAGGSVTLTMTGGVKKVSGHAVSPNFDFKISGHAYISVGVGLEAGVPWLCNADLMLWFELHAGAEHGFVTGSGSVSAWLNIKFTSSLTIIGVEIYDLEIASYKVDIYNTYWRRRGGGGIYDELGIPEGRFTPEERFRQVLDERIPKVNSSTRVLEEERLLADTGADKDIQLKTGPEGDIWAVWTHSADGLPNNQEIYVSSFDGDTWKEPAAVTADERSDSSPVLAFDGRGRPVVVWVRNENVLPEKCTYRDLYLSLNGTELYYSTLIAGKWSAPEPITDNERAEASPVLADNGRGGVFAVWTAFEGMDGLSVEGNDIYLAELDGDEWQEPVKVTEGDGYKLTPAASYDREGKKPLIVWSLDSDENVSTTDDRELYATGRVDDGFSEPTRLTDNDRGEFEPSVCGGYAGEEMRILYRTRVVNATEVWLAEPESGAEPVRLFSTERMLRHPRAAFDPEGTGVLIWSEYDKEENRTPQLFRKTHLPGDSMDEWSERTAVTNNSFANLGGEVAMGRNGVATVVWLAGYGGSDRDVYWRRTDIETENPLSLTSDDVRKSCEPGERIVFLIQLSNSRNTPVKVELEVEGERAGWAELSVSEIVVQGMNGREIRVEVTVPESAGEELAVLQVTARVSGEKEFQRSVELTADIVPGEEESSEDAGEDERGGFPWLFALVGGAVLLVLALVILVFILRRRRRPPDNSGEEEGEGIGGDGETAEDPDSSPEVTGASGPLCPDCGGIGAYYPDAERYWCDTCQDYVGEGGKDEEPGNHPGGQGDRHVCPGCGESAGYYPEFECYWCETCLDYVEV